jgi:hypothetical protein
MSNRAEEAGRRDHCEIQFGQVATYPFSRCKLGSNLGPNAAELGPKSGTTTQNKAKRTNEIDFISRLCKQGVAGSNPVTSTKIINKHAGYERQGENVGEARRVLVDCLVDFWRLVDRQGEHSSQAHEVPRTSHPCRFSQGEGSTEGNLVSSGSRTESTCGKLSLEDAAKRGDLGVSQFDGNAVYQGQRLYGSRTSLLSSFLWHSESASIAATSEN